jgi:ribosomal-protein-alanine N-acetyltransferase
MSMDIMEIFDINKKTFSQFPVIEGIFDKNGNEYILRKHTHDDAENYMKFYNIPQIAKFLPNGLIFKNTQEAIREIDFRTGNFDKKETIYWCIAQKTTNKLIGGCGFLDWSRFNRRIEIAYDIMPEFQNLGIVSSAVKKITAFAFLNLHVVRVGATTPVDNQASIHLLTKKANFTFEGTLQSYKFWKGSYIDVNHFAISIKSFINLYKEGDYNFLSLRDKADIESLYDKLYNKIHNN